MNSIYFNELFLPLIPQFLNPEFPNLALMNIKRVPQANSFIESMTGSELYETYGLSACSDQNTGAWAAGNFEFWFLRRFSLFG